MTVALAEHKRHLESVVQRLNESLDKAVYSACWRKIDGVWGYCCSFFISFGHSFFLPRLLYLVSNTMTWWYLLITFDRFWSMLPHLCFFYAGHTVTLRCLSGLETLDMAQEQDNKTKDYKTTRKTRQGLEAGQLAPEVETSSNVTTINACMSVVVLCCLSLCLLKSTVSILVFIVLLWCCSLLSWSPMLASQSPR